MSITTKALSTLGDKVLVGVIENGETIYDRYVTQSEWESDAAAITAKLADYLGKQVAPEAVGSCQGITVTMDDAEIAAKLAELEAANGD